MKHNQEKWRYGFRLFKPGTPRKVKVRSLVFFFILLAIIFFQAFYWLFANKVEPLVWGMPFSMFFIVLVIIIEFFVLLVLYFLEGADEKKGGDA